jgi:glycine/D-amino acid oxidase-like deaminating enzyme
MTKIHSANHANSYYAYTINNPVNYPFLNESISTDICIIGGGFTGVASAIELAERGYQVVLLEAHRIAWGASGRNGGQMIRGIGHDLEIFRNQIGQDGINAIRDMGLKANQIVIDRIEQYKIECDLTMGYCDLANNAKHIKSISQDYDSLCKTGYAKNIRLLNSQQLQTEVVGSNSYLGGMEDKASGHLHPLNLCVAEAEIARSLGVKIFEESRVIKIDKGEQLKIHTDYGQVTAQKVILAGNAYLQNLEPKISDKILPAGSYIIATEPLDRDIYSTLLPNNHAVCDSKIALDYFRLSADKRLLFGGLCNYSGRDPKDIKASLRPKMLKVFPQLSKVKIDFQWGGMIGIGANRLPQIGRIDSNIYYAQAYSGHGVNVTHTAAKLLAEAVSEQNRLDDFNYFAQIKHMTFPGGKHLRSPLLAIGMLYHQALALF